MASITRRQVKGHTYYYAVASQRIDGKPRLTLQKCLGSAEKIIAAVEQQRTPVEPREIDTFSFGGVAAAWAMAERLRLLEILDRHLPKRQQGISPAQYLLLAAINRCTSPKSKRAFAHWYASTSLLRLCPVPVKLLSSQRFWDHMHRLKEDTFARIEADLVPHLLREFHLDLHCLAYDATNSLPLSIPSTQPANWRKEAKAKSTVPTCASLASPCWSAWIFTCRCFTTPTLETNTTAKLWPPSWMTW